MPRESFIVIKEIYFSFSERSGDVIRLHKDAIVEIGNGQVFIPISDKIWIEKNLNNRLIDEYFQKVNQVNEEVKMIKEKRPKAKKKVLNKFSRIFQQ